MAKGKISRDVEEKADRPNVHKMAATIGATKNVVSTPCFPICMQWFMRQVDFTPGLPLECLR